MNSKSLKCDGSCVEMALEGERLCKAGEFESGVRYLETALRMGTKDVKTLGTIYNDLGNAYLMLKDYTKSLEYHKQNLTLSRSMGDRMEEATASGNVGIVLKLVGEYDEAFSCCQRQLDISREHDDKASEAMALYNLGSIFHSKSKQQAILHSMEPGSYSSQCREFLETAISYYEANLLLVRQLDDKASVARTCGNLGNTHYLLGNFKKAIALHEERLKLAEMFRDMPGQRRAYINLANAHMFLGQFREAVRIYKKAIELAILMKDLTLEAQACFSLGNTYTILSDYPAAIHSHQRHLAIAQKLRDRVGECKACWSLTNCYSKTRNAAKALDFARRHLSICKELEDEKGYEMAQMNLLELKVLANSWEEDSSFKRTNSCKEKGEVEKVDDDVSCGSRTKSMENLLTPDKSTSRFQFKAPDITLWKRQTKAGKQGHNSKDNKAVKKQSSSNSEEGAFIELLSKYQSRRIDDQRCSSNVLGRSFGIAPFATLDDDDDKENRAAAACDVVAGSSSSSRDEEDDFLDLLLGMQSSRMDDQRSQPPLLLNGGPSSYHHARPPVPTASPSHSAADADEQFYEMLIKCQGARLDSQRSDLPTSLAGDLRSPTVPDEDFLSLIHRYQRNRIDEQRSFLPNASFSSSSSTRQLPTRTNLVSPPDLLNH